MSPRSNSQIAQYHNPQQQRIHNWISQFPSQLQQEYNALCFAAVHPASHYEGEGDALLRLENFIAAVAEQGPPCNLPSFLIRELYRIEVFQSYAQEWGVAVGTLRPLVESKIAKAIQEVDWEAVF